MNYNQKDLKDIINKFDDTLTIQYIRRIMKTLKTLDEQQQPKFLISVLNDIANILKDTQESPQLKYKTHKLIIHLVLMADPLVYIHFEKDLFNIMKANCSYNKRQPFQVRGLQYFSRSPHYIKASPQQKKNIKNYGKQYIIFSLQTISILAKWLPCSFENQAQPSNYLKAYDALVKEGVKFPEQDDYIFYEQLIVERIEEQIGQIQQQIYEQSHEQSYEQSKQSAANAINLELQIDSQRVSAINKSINRSKMKNGSINNSKLCRSDIKQAQRDKQKQNKQSILLKQEYFIEQNQTIKRYKLKIVQLQRQNSQLKEKVFGYEKNKFYEEPFSKNYLEQHIEKMKNIIVSLENKISTLQNQLRVCEERLMQKDKQIVELTMIRNNLNRQLQQHRKKQKNTDKLIPKTQYMILKRQNNKLKERLLTDCIQPKQFKNTWEHAVKSSKNNMFNCQRKQQLLQKNYNVNFKDTKSCFQPFYDNLSQQHKIRLKKAILRQKQLLYKGDEIQIGTITKQVTKNIDYQLKMILVITNVSDYEFENFSLDLIYHKELKAQYQNTKLKIQSGQQIKIQIAITLKEINFRCMLAYINYCTIKAAEKIVLILPVSKLKIFQPQVLTPLPTSYKKVQTVLHKDNKIIPTFQKIKTYFKQIFESKDRNNKVTYMIKYEFLERNYFVQFSQIDQQLRIAVYGSSKHLHECQKISNQFQFLFGK